MNDACAMAHDCDPEPARLITREHAALACTRIRATTGAAADEKVRWHPSMRHQNLDHWERGEYQGRPNLKLPRGVEAEAAGAATFSSDSFTTLRVSRGFINGGCQKQIQSLMTVLVPRTKCKSTHFVLSSAIHSFTLCHSFAPSRLYWTGSRTTRNISIIVNLSLPLSLINLTQQTYYPIARPHLLTISVPLLNGRECLEGWGRPLASDMASSLLDPDPPRPLAESIAIATRSVHAKLNKLIIARLPLVLPPRASDPAIYVSGLLHIAPIYIAFEALWRDLLDAPPSSASRGRDSDECDPDIPLLNNGSVSLPTNEETAIRNPLVCSRIRDLLEHLYLPGLMRSDRMRADIAALTGWPDHVVEEQLKSVSQMGQLAIFTQHIQRAIESRPHVLLAYSYILFMALFAGGRFIRASLESAGPCFWERVPSPVRPNLHNCQRHAAKTSERASGLSDDEIPENDFHSHASHTMPLRFFHFPTPVDGEDLKQEFKQRLADSEALLTAHEKQDIVQEAVCIFDNMTLLVQQLDKVCDQPPCDDVDHDGLFQDLASFLRNPMNGRLRDSIAVTRERTTRSSRISSSSEDNSYNFNKQTQDVRYTAANSSADGNTSQNHPPILSMGGVELCPGFPKSMRFERALPRPPHDKNTSKSVGSVLNENLSMAFKRVRTLSLTHWLTILGLGTLALGLVLSSRRDQVEGRSS
ncbi:hypothetical protein G7046_g5486 [Stylonectria norvegica]|nr:hypothetical protein G7046_g5486 [Stylonectria norvegica]